MTDRDLKGQLGYASEIAQYVVILGPKELKENKAVVKNLTTEEQTTVSLDTIEDALR